MSIKVLDALKKAHPTPRSCLYDPVTPQDVLATEFPEEPIAQARCGRRQRRLGGGHRQQPPVARHISPRTISEFTSPGGFVFDYWNHFSHLADLRARRLVLRRRPQRMRRLVMAKRVVVTGGGGFIGAYLVKRLVRDGWDVAVVDTMVRGDASRFAEVADDVELFTVRRA